MRKVRLLALAALATALACASRPLTPPLSPAGGEGEKRGATANSTAGPAVVRGMDAAEVRRRLGAPQRIEQVSSAAVHGARYERWSYGSGEVVLVDGKVLDVLP